VSDDALLGGLEGEAAEVRRRLIAELRAAGHDEAALVDAAARGRLALLPAERAIRGNATLSTADMVRETGVDPDLLERVMQAAGVAIPRRDEAAWTTRDVGLARLVCGLLEAGIDPAAIVNLGRTLGDLGARLGAAAIVDLGSGLAREGDDELELAHRLARASEQTEQHLVDALGSVLRDRGIEQLLAIELDAGAIAEGRLAGATVVTVAFADVVGFTRLGEELGAERLEGVASQLATLGSAVVAGTTVRVVKTIGDALLLLGQHPREVVDVVLALQDAADADPEFPRLRCGVATGDAVPRSGDWFGPAINRASRVCSTARPDSVVVDDVTRDLLEDEDGLDWRPLGRLRLKGIGRVALHRVRHAADDDA
jgi:adenylate cyclase